MQDQLEGTQILPPKGLAARAGRALVELFAAASWLYLAVKVFVFDFDVYLIDTFAPQFKWLLNFKFFFFVGLLALVIFFGKGMPGIKAIALVAFYPLIVVLWRIPKIILKTNSWVMVFAVINLIASVSRSFRRKVIIAAAFLISAAILLATRNQMAILITSTVLLGVLLFTYLRAIFGAFQANAISRTYKWALPNIRTHIIASNRLDQDLKGLPLAQLSGEQLKKWGSKLETPVLVNRAYLFVARKIREYQRSPAPFIAATASIFLLFFATMFVFACVAYGAYTINAELYEITSAPSFFTFLWFSFNALLFNFVKEIAPSSSIAQFLWMAEAFCALFLVTILIFLYFSIRNQRQSGELDDVIIAMEFESREMESFIKSEYQIDSIETAMVELNRLETSVAKLLLWLTDNIH